MANNYILILFEYYWTIVMHDKSSLVTVPLISFLSNVNRHLNKQSIQIIAMVPFVKKLKYTWFIDKSGY